MLIESIEIEGVGRFRDPVSIGPLQPGLNILAQPNEWGKSTVIHTLCRALFDRYNSQNEEIRAMRPLGTSLSPRIELCFSAKGDRYRLQKRFLDGKLSELSRWGSGAWERTDESDKADQRVRELLGAPRLEGQKAKPETWGLIRYLWCRQDEPADWPCWDGDCGETTRRKLATVEIDPLMRRLAERLATLGEEQFTARGQVKKGGALFQAETEHAAAVAELEELRQLRADLEQLEAQYTAAVAGLPRLEREKTERAAEAVRWREQAEAAEKLNARIALARSEFQRAEAALRKIRDDRDTLSRLTESAADEATAQAENVRRAKASQSAAEQLRVKLDAAGAAARDREQAQAARQEKLVRLQALLRSRRRAERLATLMLTQNHAQATAAELAALEQRLAGLAALSDGDLKRGRELERKLAGQRAHLAAAGISVRLEPLAAARVSALADGAALAPLELPAGAAERVQAARTLTLELAGWGRVVVESGAQETAQWQSEITATSGQLAALLAGAGVATLAEAETAAWQAKEWRAQQQAACAKLQGILSEFQTPAALAAAVAKAGKELEQLRALHRFTEDEQQCSDISLQADEQTLAAAEAAEKKAERTFAAELEQLRTELESAQHRAADAEQKVAVSLGRGKMLGERSAELVALYPEGLGSALADAQAHFVRAEARLSVARSELLPEAETLPERAGRAARAAAELDQELQQKQRDADRLKVQLEERGGEALHAREAEAEERRQAARARGDTLRREGLAARLLGELIQRREQASIRAVLSPLEDRLSQTFAQLTGVPERRVWFDEHLAVHGIGHRRDEVVSFENLSRGAREQLLLALRAAIALEVTAAEGPQCLVLDDVLVHTDAVRHENVLDFLQQLSAHVQIILLTCHAERYRGLGHVVPVERKPRA